MDNQEGTSGSDLSEPQAEGSQPQIEESPPQIDETPQQIDEDVADVEEEPAPKAEESASKTALKKKQKRKFRPAETPRYLPHAVPKSVLTNDLKLYNNHRYNIYNAESKVDCKPPVMNPHHYIKGQAMMKEARRLLEIDIENRKLLKTINLINRTKGKVDTFNPVAYQNLSSWRVHYLKMKAIDGENKIVYRRLRTVKSTYSKRNMDAEWGRVKEGLANAARFPLVLLKTKTLDQKLSEQTSISEGLDVLQSPVERPKCYMDFQVKDGVHLGRVLIELYQDFVPVTVQNFLAICRGEGGLSYVNCRVHKIVKGKYMETGDITSGNGKGGASIYGKRFAEENFALKHSKAGVLSMVRVGSKENSSQFSITFDEVAGLDGKRVVFGRIVRGNETIRKIQDLGRKLQGPPSVSILIAGCGEYVKGKTPPRPCYKYSSMC